MQGRKKNYAPRQVAGSRQHASGIRAHNSTGRYRVKASIRNIEPVSRARDLRGLSRYPLNCPDDRHGGELVTCGKARLMCAGSLGLGQDS